MWLPEYYGLPEYYFQIKKGIWAEIFLKIFLPELENIFSLSFRFSLSIEKVEINSFQNGYLLMTAILGEVSGRGSLFL